MIDTISIDIQLRGPLKVEDFRYPVEITSRYANNTKNNQPKKQKSVHLCWSDHLAGYYLPSVDYIDYPDPRGGGQEYGHHGRCYILRITASLPKLVYGNNISELADDQFGDVVRLLHSELVFLELPIDIAEEDIRNAKVSRIDYGKNIIFPSATSMFAISEVLAKAEHPANSKYSQVQYRDGELFRHNIKKRSIVLYDKTAEYFSTADTSAPPYDKTFAQPKLSNHPHMAKVLRYEVQIQTAKQLRQELKSIGYKNVTTFRDLFSSDVASKILVHHFSKETRHIVGTSNQLVPETIHQYFTEIIEKIDDRGPQKIFGTFGFNTLVDICGANSIKQTVSLYSNPKSWNRARDSLTISIDRSSPYDFIDRIAKAITDMEPISIEELRNDN